MKQNQGYGKLNKKKIDYRKYNERAHAKSRKRVAALPHHTNQSYRLRSSRFKKGILIYSISLCLIMAAVLIFIGVSLSKYQKVSDEENELKAYQEQVKRSPQIFFEDYIDNITVDELYKRYVEANPEVKESKDALMIKLNAQIVNRPLLRLRSSDYTDASPSYVLKSDDGVILKVNLKGIEKYWEVDSLEFFLDEDSSELIVPTDAVIYVDGNELTKGLVVETVATGRPLEYEDTLANPVMYDRYLVPDLKDDSVVEVTGSRNYEIMEEEDNRYSYALPNEESAFFTDKAAGFVKSLLYYYSCGKSNTDANMNAVLSHVASSSEASKLITASLSGVEWKYPHPDVTYSLMFEPVYAEAENLRRVDVLYQKNGDMIDDVTYEGIYRIYFINKGNGYAIYNFELR